MWLKRPVYTPFTGRERHGNKNVSVTGVAEGTKLELGSLLGNQETRGWYPLTAWLGEGLSGFQGLLLGRE